LEVKELADHNLGYIGEQSGRKQQEVKFDRSSRITDWMICIPLFAQTVEKVNTAVATVSLIIKMHEVIDGGCLFIRNM
jgi:hypothetical protein